MDVHAFDALTRADQPASRWEEGLALYRGPFLEGFSLKDSAPFEEWVQITREQLERGCLAALTRLAEYTEVGGDLVKACEIAWRAVGLAPWQEEAHRRLMRLLALSGQRSAALAQFETCRHMLKRELRVEPSAETAALYEHIRAGELRALTEAAKSAIAPPEPHLDKQGIAPAPVIPPLYDQVIRQEKTAAAPVRRPFLTTTDYALAGRQAEQQKLRTVWRELNAPHFVWIEGEAGMGKTRLAEDLLMLAEAEGQDVARTRTHALASRLAYEPIADWLRTEALRAGLTDLDAVWLTEVARLLPELLGERPGLPPPGPIADGWQHKRFFEALARAFTVSRDRLLLVLDDLQWCDAETLNWLGYLLDVAERPLLVIGTVRMEEVDNDHALPRLRYDLARQGKLTEIHLNSLTVDETLALARQITAHEVSADWAGRFYRDTGGNPLFIIESMRAAETAGDVRSQLDDRKHPSAIVIMEGAGGMPVPIPPKVMAVIQSRLQRLSPEAQTLAQVAATIGHGFDVELLAQATGKAEEDVLNVLDELWQKRIIREYDGACYDFSHDRIRDVAYAMIGPVKRRLLHRQVAKALERIYGDDTDPVAEELAVHYQRAGAFKQALAYFRQAAEAARRVYAHAQVVENLQRAIEAVHMLPGSPENKEIEFNLWHDLGYARILVHDWGSEPVGEAWSKAYDLAMQTDSALLHGRALLRLMAYHGNRGQWREAIKFSEPALAALQEAKEPDWILHACHGHGYVLYHMGRPERAMEYFAKVLAPADHALALPSEQFRKRALIGSQLRAAQTCWMLGYPDQARRVCDGVIAQAHLDSAEQDRFSTLDFSAMLYSFVGDADTVLQLGEELLELSIKHDYAFYQRAGRMYTGWARAQKGDARTGAKQVRESVNGHRDRGIRMFEPYWRSLLAEALALAGDTGEALSEVDQALAYADESGNVYWSAHLLKLKGDLLQAQSAADHEVERWYQQAINTAQTQQARSLELRATTSLCRLWLRQGRLPAARQRLAGIYGWFTEGLDTQDLKDARALLEDVQRMEERKDDEGAHALLSSPPLMSN